MSAFDPKRTLAAQNCCCAIWPLTPISSLANPCCNHQLAAELVSSNVDLIVTHTTPGSLAAKRATTTIPIVIALIGDPVTAGVVANVARPGGNITGQSFFGAELRAKRIELLKELMPRLTQVAVILNAANSAAETDYQTMEATAQ